MCAITAPYGYCAMLVIDLVQRHHSWIGLLVSFILWKPGEGIQASSNSGVSGLCCLNESHSDWGELKSQCDFTFQSLLTKDIEHQNGCSDFIDTIFVC